MEGRSAEILRDGRVVEFTESSSFGRPGGAERPVASRQPAPELFEFSPGELASLSNRLHAEGGAGIAPPSLTRLYDGSVIDVPKMSVFPKVAGHSCCTAGAGRSSSEPSVCNDIRYASMAGQSAAFLASFHTNVA